MILDIFAILTYHPPEAQRTRFCKAHFSSFNVAMIVLFVIARKYWLGMLASVISDLFDWFGIRGYAWIRSKKASYNTRAVFHDLINRIGEPIRSRLPCLLYEKKGTIVEILLDLVLIFLILSLS